jgi:hypothetical protein
MVKIIKGAVLIILFTACYKDKALNLEKYNLVYDYGKFIKVDFKKKTLQVHYADLKEDSDLVLSNSENSLILKSFEANRIYEIKGMYEYPNCSWQMPSFPDCLSVYDGNKMQSEMYYNEKPYCPFKKPQKGSQEERIICFMNDVKRILEKNKSFMKAYKEYDKLKEERPNVFFL